MTKFVSSKLNDEPDYWLVDLEQGVVSIMDKSASTTIIEDESARTGATFIKGVDVAILSEMREDAFSSKFDK